jgi:microsomal dipeptidase-like Zn-dependent dipeptidase
MNYIDMHCDTLVKAVEQKKETAKTTGTYDGGCEKTAPVWRKGTVFCHVFTAEKRRKLE